MVSEQEFYDALAGRLGKDIADKLRSCTIGIAGLGGLGSNIAMLLARAGVGKLVIADFDNVELSNIHRQNYPLDSIGMKKTAATAKEIERINPWCKVVQHDVKITKDNVSIFSDCDVVCEAFDDAEQKIMLIESLSEMNKKTVSGNGMAGIQSANSIVTKKISDDIYICGDGITDVKGNSLMPSRVTVCAAHQANAAIRIILGLEP